jgi:hypothetical protein
VRKLIVRSGAILFLTGVFCALVAHPEDQMAFGAEGVAGLALCMIGVALIPERK